MKSDLHCVGVAFQAYYISSLFDNRVKESLILINMGDQRLLAEACMSIWLPQGGSIFICVRSVEEAQLIRKKFPMVNLKHLYILIQAARRPLTLQ